MHLPLSFLFIYYPNTHLNTHTDWIRTPDVTPMVFKAGGGGVFYTSSRCSYEEMCSKWRQLKAIMFNLIQSLSPSCFSWSVLTELWLKRQHPYGQYIKHNRKLYILSEQQFRFVYFSDNKNQSSGWSIDNVQMISCCSVKANRKHLFSIISGKMRSWARKQVKVWVLSWFLFLLFL